MFILFYIIQTGRNRECQNRIEIRTELISEIHERQEMKETNDFTKKLFLVVVEPFKVKFAQSCSKPQSVRSYNSAQKIVTLQKSKYLIYFPE